MCSDHIIITFFPFATERCSGSHAHEHGEHGEHGKHECEYN